MLLFQGLIGNGARLLEKLLFHVIEMCVMGLLRQKKAPLSDEKVTVGNHDFVDVGTCVVSMGLVVLAMKESVSFCA